MAEFLIKAIDANHADPVKDKAGCYKRGDVVVVMPDGWQWGRLECPPKFVIVKIPGMTVEEAKKYIESEKGTQETTATWNQLDWDMAVILGDYQEFLARPTLEGTTDTETLISVSLSKWVEMQAGTNWYPFILQPSADTLSDSECKLSGIVRTVDLRGNVEVIATRRMYKLSIDDTPTETKNELESKGIATMTKADAEAVLKDKIKMVAI